VDDDNRGHGLLVSVSLQHDVVYAYHLAPAPDFLFNEGRRFGRRPAVRLDMERAEALLHIGHLEHLDGGPRDLILQFRLEPGWPHHRVPGAREKVGEPTSALVGTSGIAAARALSVTAKTFNLPS